MKRNYFNITLKITAAIIAALMLSLSACNDDDDDDDDDDDNGTPSSNVLEGNTGTMTLKSDKTYTLDGFVYVGDGETLTIEAGTMIQGNPGGGENASALVVTRGGKIIAEGTSTDPIIFTANGDTKEGAYPLYANGLWGGVIILGKATHNEPVDAMAIEGIPDDVGFDNKWGGTDDADNSGTFKYVQIRHGGTDIGAGNEINGLTMGGVGSGTTISYVEVLSNRDDAFEWFGGAAQCDHLIASYCGDDSYDYDAGWHGKGQFWFTIQDEKANRCGEHDGGHDDEAGTPHSNPVIYNVTYIAKGKDGEMITFRDNAGGTYANSIFMNAYKDGIEVEYRGDKGTNGGAYNMLKEGNLVIKNNLFYAVGDTAGAADATTAFVHYVEQDDDYPGAADVDADLQSHFSDNTNEILATNPGITASNPVPSSNPGTISQASLPADDDFFKTADYHGAFEPGGDNWGKGWTRTFE